MAKVTVVGFVINAEVELVEDQPSWLLENIAGTDLSSLNPETLLIILESLTSQLEEELRYETHSTNHQQCDRVNPDQV